MIRAEGGKLVRPQAVDRIIVALDSCWPRKGAVVLLFHTLFVTFPFHLKHHYRYTYTLTWSTFPSLSITRPF